MSINSNNIPLNTYQNIKDSSYISQSKINKGKKVASQKQISKNNSSKMNNFKNLQKSNRKSMKNLNSKLTSVNYVKPLFYTMYSQIKPIDKRNFGYRYDRDFLFIPFPTILNIDKTQFKALTHRNKSEEKKNSNSKCKYLNKSKNKKNNENSENNDNTKKIVKDINDIKNEKATLIQACFRGYLLRKNLYNSLSPYSKFRHDVKIVEKIVKLKSLFFEKLKQLKIEYEKNKNKKKGKKNTNKKKKFKICSNGNFNIINKNYKINMANKNNKIKKNDKFNINNCYDNNYDKFKNGINNYVIIDKESYNKKKELYEKKLNELIEENKKIKNMKNIKLNIQI